MSLDFPPVIAAYGANHFRRRRFIELVIRTCEDHNYLVEEISADDIVPTVSSRGVLFNDLTLALIDEPGDFDLDFVLDYNKDKDNSLILFFTQKGAPKAKTSLKKLVKKIPDQVRKFDEVPIFKRDEDAASFVLEEVKAAGRTMTPALSNALVAKVGNDLGVLRFEVLKLVTLCEALGSEEVKPIYVKHTMADLMESSLFPLLEAVSDRSPKGVLTQATRIGKTHTGDPTMRVIAFLRSQVLNWLCAANLKGKGFDAKQSADVMGMHPFAFQKNVLPAANKWGTKKLIRLVQILSESERNVKRGAIRPWVGMISRLTQICGEG